MSQKASIKILEQRIQELDRENATLKQKMATLRNFENIGCIFKTAPIGIAVLVNQKIVRANRWLCEITGYSLDELTESDTRIFYPDEASYQKMLSQKSDPDVIHGCKSIEAKWQTKDGRIINTCLAYSLIDKNDFTKGMTITVQDVSIRKSNEDSLKFQSDVLNNINDIVMVVDLEGHIVYVNDAHNKIMNVGPHQAMGKAFDDLMRGCYLKGSQKAIIDKTARHGTWHEQVVVTSLDGKTLDLDYRTQLIKGSDAEPKYVVSIATDITEKKKSENENERLRTVIEQSPQAVFITDSQGIIEYVNNAFERQTGYRRPDCIGMDLRELRSNKHDRQFYINLWATISCGHTWNGHTINKRKDGSLYTANTTISSVKDENGTITNYVCIQRDTSSEIEINEKIARIQKVESLGTLAGGMIHDLNNMLFPILGNAEILLLDSSSHSSETKEILEQIYESAIQAKDLVQQVLTFSRHKKIEKRPVLIQNSINTVLKLMKFGVPQNISVKKVVNPNCPYIVADPTQIHQIIMNLVSNSIYALGGTGGVIQIALMPANECKSDSIEIVNPENYICLSVSDTGAGMSKQVVDHIFEPFYTTKDNGKGTGMGLSVVHGIVKDMDGEITVDSQPGKGTKFKIYFPVSSKKAVAANTVRAYGDQINVLFVDDEDVILKVAKSMLGRLGCQTTTMTDPRAALAHFKKRPLTYDLVITDMYMPHMNGDCLAENIRIIRPDIPIFFCSGVSNDITLDMMAQLSISAVLSKPLSIKEFSDNIKQIL